MPNKSTNYLKKIEIAHFPNILELNELDDGAQTVILFLDLVMKKYYFLREARDGRGGNKTE